MQEDVSIAKSLELAVTTEGQAAAAYEMLAKRFAGDDQLRALFDELAEDEHEHRREFLEILKVVPPGQTGRADDDLRFLRAMSIWDFFGEGEPLAQIEQAVDKTDTLRKIFGFERTTLGYYRAIAEVLGPNEAMELIIETEKAHVVKIMEYLTRA